MKYQPARTQLTQTDWFSHGENLRNEHVDCVVTLEADENVLSRRDATQDEIDTFCIQ